MNISIICACKNRKRALQVSLSSWLLYDEIKEIIIVDWGSSDDQTISELSLLDKRIKIVTVLNEKYFNLPHPLNLAASFATQDYILKVDCDYILNPYHNFFENYHLDNDSFISGHSKLKNPEVYDENHGITTIQKDKLNIFEIRDYVNCYSPFYIYLKGMLLVSRENFEKIKGYDENFDTFYAYDDDNIRDRLILLGLKHQKLDYDYNWIHLPHSDYVRIEHFKGFHDSGEKKHIDQMEEGDVKWNHAYYLASCHIKKNINLYSNPTSYEACRKISWDIKKMDEQHFYAQKDNTFNDKLEGFPSVYYISLEESFDRRVILEKSFYNYGIIPKSIISKRFSESNDVVKGMYAYTLNDGTKGCAISQIKAMNEWYYTSHSSEECLFICEDDLSLETVEYWDFTWKEFYNNLPKDWDCIQLLVVRDKFNSFELRERYWDDWAVTAYLIKRDHVKKIINTYYNHIDMSYNLEIPNSNLQPLAENLFFVPGKTYVQPLFVENNNFISTFIGMDDDVKEGQKNSHKISSEIVFNYWKSKGVLDEI